MKRLLNLWLRPRTAILEIGESQARFSHLRVVFSLSLVLMILTGLALWGLELLPTFSFEFFVVAAKLFIIYLFLLFTFLNLLGLTINYLARFLGGEATLFQTNTVVHWFGVSALPLVFLFVCMLWSNKFVRMHESGGVIFGFLILAFCISGLYLFHIFVKMISGIHNVSYPRALLILSMVALMVIGAGYYLVA